MITKSIPKVDNSLIRKSSLEAFSIRENFDNNSAINVLNLSDLSHPCEQFPTFHSFSKASTPLIAAKYRQTNEPTSINKSEKLESEHAAKIIPTDQSHIPQS